MNHKNFKIDLKINLQKKKQCLIT